MYNFYQAFHPTTQLPEKQCKEIGVAAIIQYRYEFEDVEYIEVKFYFDTKTVEVLGGPEIRIYSWKELGFEL